ncbi:MAG: sulfatase-like hydrolase/transferase [Planctomycetota bacterium]
MSADRPNIVFFFTDDQRFDTIGALGNERVSTPNMDELVRRGTAFTHAHIPGGTSGAVCMPSRAMLHTGRTLFHIQGAGQSISDDHLTLGEAFHRVGYRTFGAGKWHNGAESYARSFTDGDEIFFGGMADHWNVPACHFDPTGRYEATRPIVDEPHRSNEVRQRRCDHVTAGTHSSELIAEAGIEFLRDYDDDAPLLMYLSFLAPHDPRTMPEEFRRMYDPQEVELPPNFMGGHPFDNGELHIRDEMLAGFPRTPRETRRHIAEYYAMISHLDAQIGRVVEQLRAQDLLESTIVVLAGDNGLAVGRHGLFGKQNLYDHSVRVPLVFAGPGVPAGGRSEALVYLHDVLPTLCELSGVKVPQTVEGRSLTGVLRNPGQGVRDALYLAYTDKHRGVRRGGHKLIEYVVDGRHNMTQLFDLREDPWELNNLAADPSHADRLREMRAELTRMRDEWDDRDTTWGETFWAGYAPK